MITVIIEANNTNNLNDLLRSLINNAQSRDNYNIVVKGKEYCRNVVDSYITSADILLSNTPGHSIPIPDLVWNIHDDYFVLGQQWDKRLNYYKDKFEDGIVVMMPSGYKPYNIMGEQEIASLAERNPVVSGKWLELVGLCDVEMICRSLSLRHNIDRRVDIRLADITARGKIPEIPTCRTNDIDYKADIIADYIKAVQFKEQIKNHNVII